MWENNVFIQLYVVKHVIKNTKTVSNVPGSHFLYWVGSMAVHRYPQELQNEVCSYVLPDK